MLARRSFSSAFCLVWPSIEEACAAPRRLGLSCNRSANNRSTAALSLLFSVTPSSTRRSGSIEERSNFFDQRPGPNPFLWQHVIMSRMKRESDLVSHFQTRSLGFLDELPVPSPKHFGPSLHREGSNAGSMLESGT